MTQKHLLFDRRFWPLFWTQFFGAFNDNFFKNALVILITFQTKQKLPLPQEQLVALCGGIFIFPFFLFSATAGQLADTYEKSKITRFVKIFEIAIMTIALVGFYYHYVLLLLFVLFLMGLHSAVFGPIKYSYLPQLLHTEDELTASNAWFQSGTFIAILLGTIAGGISIALPENAEIYTGAFAIFFAICGYCFSRYIGEIPTNNGGSKIYYNPILSMKALLQSVFTNNKIIPPILGISWFWFFGASILSLFPSLGKNVLHGNEHVVTLLLALFSIGVGIGSFLCKLLSKTSLKPWLSSIGSFGLSVFAIEIFFATPKPQETYFSTLTLLEFLSQPYSWRVILDLFLLSLFGGLYIIPLVTRLQQSMDPAKLAQAIAANNIINSLAMVLASLALVALFAMGNSIPNIFFILGIVNLWMTLYLLKIH